MFFLCLSLLFITIFYFHLSSPHHVFEEIGQIAGALLYIHAIVPVNISGLVQAVHNFRRDILSQQKLYQEKKQPLGSSYSKWLHQHLVNLFDLVLADANSMLAMLDSLHNSLPQVTTESHLQLHASHVYPVKCLLPFAIISGVIGKLMGWFTQCHLNNLWDCLDEVQD
jgi:hypothetical protein